MIVFLLAVQAALILGILVLLMPYASYAIGTFLNWLEKKERERDDQS